MTHKSYLLNQHQQYLFDIAYQSIRHGMKYDKPLVPEPRDCSSALQEKQGLFVTLSLNGDLRGCIGNTEPVSPLYIATAECAFNAAFRDPRFNRLTQDEYRDISLAISILSPKTELRFDSEQSLLEQLRPGKDGLVIMKAAHSATFLPSVWAKTESTEAFLALLKTKAGMRPDETPEAAWVYETVTVEDVYRVQARHV